MRSAAPDIVEQRVKTRLAQASRIYFQNEMRTTLEVEAERDRLDRQEGSILLLDGGRQHVGQRRDNPKEGNRDIGQNGPFSKCAC